MVAILSEFLIYAILIHKITSANEAFDKKIRNGFGHVENDEHSPSLSNNLYGKRVNYALMPLMGGMYGKRTFVPFHGGMYGKRRSLPFNRYYNKQLLSPEITLNEDLIPSVYYDGNGKFGQFPYKLWRQYQLKEDNSDYYKDNSYPSQPFPELVKPLSLKHNSLGLKQSKKKLLQMDFLIFENTLCIPPSIPAKDSQNVDCCKLPREIFPHKTIYEEFCSVLYFGVMADGPDGRFCRLSSSQKRQSINCDPGWIAFYEGLNQFCYKAFTINSTDKIVDIMSKKMVIRAEKKGNSKTLRVLNGAQNLLCDSVDRNTYYYYIGLYRNDFDWRWRSYDEKAYSHLEEQGQQLLDYLNQPRSNHTWPDGTRIFADGWHDVDDITTNVVMSNCGMWRDFNSSLTDFKHNKIHVENQGFICAYHV
ncbi:hypothetical protein DINM_001351 [Dirofilaria immitis]|nr:hypothetical protein [Dirofilaria immitis]